MKREKRGLNQKRIKQKKEEEKSGWSEKTFGLKNVWAEKSFLGWKIKGNTPKEKKKEGWRKVRDAEAEKGAPKLKRKRALENRTRKEGCWPEEKKRRKRHWSWKKKRAGTEKGAALKLNREGWADNFSAFIFLWIFSKKWWWIRLCWIWLLAWTKFSLF